MCAVISASEGAITGAATGAASGAVVSAVTSAVKHRLKTGSWKGVGKAAVEGAAQGAIDGAFSGAITGAISGALHPTNCFVAGTVVLTASGYVVIEDICEGDLVWSWDEDTGQTELKEVKATFVNEASELIHLYIGKEKITTTPGHPFYVEREGWRQAIDLRAGDILITVNGETVVLEQIQHEILESPVKVYNFEVEDYHTYYVGALDVLTHNICTNPGGRHGGAEHRDKVNEVKQNLIDKGWKVSQYEQRISVGGGRYRYLDIIATKNGKTIFYQIGRTTTQGKPVARELRALRDLGRVAKVYFVSYR